MTRRSKACAIRRCRCSACNTIPRLPPAPPLPPSRLAYHDGGVEGMRRWLCKETTIDQTAGPRLRCFLGRGLCLVLFCAAVCSASHAQLAVDSPIRLSHVQGIVVNSWGKPVPNLEVTLSQDEKVLFRTHTEQTGTFQFDHAEGNYLFRVARSEYGPAARQNAVRDELATMAERKNLYIILGPGACTDECSSVLTSKREFDQALHKMNRH